jgi:hypothetical protein
VLGKDCIGLLLGHGLSLGTSRLTTGLAK